MEDPPAPSEHLRTILYHISGAIRQLRSYADGGPTLYALSIFGVKPGGAGAATLAGPAVDAGGLGGWPPAAAALAREAFAQPGRRRPGSVLVFATLQAGKVAHCIRVSLSAPRPGAGPPPGAEPRLYAETCAALGG